MSFAHDEPGTTAQAWRDHPSWSTLSGLEGLLDQVDRVIVLAAHPDDESLGAGGLAAVAHDRGLTVQAVVATAGEASHPGSSTYPPEKLAVQRRLEAQAAWEVLAPGGSALVLDLPDGEVARHEVALVERLVDLVGDGRRTLLLAPWRNDGHPDHEAVGRAATTLASRTGARLLEYPVWFWHWGDPDDAPWGSLRRLELDPEATARKDRAVRAHRTQVLPLSDEPGDEVLLTPALLAHFAGPREVYVEEAVQDNALDELHAAHDDPWGVDERWYEERKRALLLAVLPRREFRRGLEVGCSTGALSAALAGRCRELVAVDASARALQRARERVADLDHVRVEGHSVPDEWPEGGFDLVVISEVGYFLSPAALDALVERVRGCLVADGVVVLCHWRHPTVGWVLDGPDVRARFVASGVAPVVAEYVDRDIELVLLGGPGTMPDPHE